MLYHLCQDTARKERLLSFVKSLPEQDIVDIRFVETPRDEVMVQLVENFGGRERTMDADSLSDGTLRVLALAAFLLTAPAGSLLVVEELDNGIHPSRARDLGGTDAGHRPPAAGADSADVAQSRLTGCLAV